MEGSCSRNGELFVLLSLVAFNPSVFIALCRLR